MSYVWLVRSMDQLVVRIMDQLVTYFSVKLANSPVSPSFRSLQSEASKSWQAVKKTVNPIYNVVIVLHDPLT